MKHKDAYTPMDCGPIFDHVHGHGIGELVYHFAKAHGMPADAVVEEFLSNHASLEEFPDYENVWDEAEAWLNENCDVTKDGIYFWGVSDNEDCDGDWGLWSVEENWNCTSYQGEAEAEND